MQHQSHFLALIQDYATILLDAPDSDQRVEISYEIAEDHDLAASILMLLAEQIHPLLPPPDMQHPIDPKGLIQ